MRLLRFLQSQPWIEDELYKPSYLETFEYLISHSDTQIAKDLHDNQSEIRLPIKHTWDGHEFEGRWYIGRWDRGTHAKPVGKFTEYDNRKPVVEFIINQTRRNSKTINAILNSPNIRAQDRLPLLYHNREFYVVEIAVGVRPRRTIFGHKKVDDSEFVVLPAKGACLDEFIAEYKKTGTIECRK